MNYPLSCLQERLTITMVCQISCPFCQFGAEFLQDDVHVTHKSYNKVLDTVYWSYETCLLMS
jgi:2-iminoacetate synthase ThiH